MKVKPSKECRTPEELAELRAYVALRVSAVQIQKERFVAAKEVTQRDMQFEVHLIL